MKRILLIVVLAVIPRLLHAQTDKADSAAVAKTLRELLSICKNVDFADPKTTDLGTFYKAAPYIVYRGDDATRKWKDFTDYSKEDEKKQVNEICYRINGSVNQDDHYEFVQYVTQTESEGKWCAIIVSFTKKGKQQKLLFAFLKIKGRFALGDIDRA